MSLAREVSHGVQFLANYLYSKLIERRTRLNDFDPAPEKRISTDDRPMRFVLSVNWDLPFGKERGAGASLHPALSQIISGWTVNTIYTAQPGGPLSWGNIIYLGGDLAVDNRSIDRVFDVTRFNRNAQEQLSQNVRAFPSQFSTPRQHGVNNMDFSVLKNNYITERIDLQLRAEFFNFLNRPSFSAPNTTPASAAFGTITSQANLARSTQLALRLVW